MNNENQNGFNPDLNNGVNGYDTNISNNIQPQTNQNVNLGSLNQTTGLENNIQIQQANPMNLNQQIEVESNTQTQQTNLSSNDKERKKKSKFPLVIVIILAIILLGIFIVYPFVRDNFINSPENVFKNSIDNVVHKLNYSLDEYDIGSSLYDFNFKIDTNVQELSSFKDYTFGLRAGSDGKSSEAKLYMVDGKNKEYSYTAYLKNSKLYEKFSSFDKIIDKGNFENSDFDELFDSLENANSEDMKYIINKSSGLLKDNLDKNKFNRSDSQIKVNNEEIKVIKNTYTLDSKERDRLYKAVLEGLYSDSKAMEILNKYGMSNEDMKSMIDEKATSDEDTVFFNIYMNNGDFAGFDVLKNEEFILSYYTAGGNFDLAFGPYISASGRKDGDVTKVSMMEYGQESISLSVRKFEENNVDFDYVITGENVSGTVNYNRTVAKNMSSGTLRLLVKDGNNSFNVTANLKEEKAKIADFDDSKVVTISEAEEEKVINDFIISLQDTPFGSLIYSSSDFSTDGWSLDDAI